MWEVQNLHLCFIYYRVTGQWVEDVDFSLEADGKILKVINPDPGGLPNIPYDEKNTTDVPMTSKRLVFIVSSRLRYTQSKDIHQRYFSIFL